MTLNVRLTLQGLELCASRPMAIIDAANHVESVWQLSVQKEAGLNELCPGCQPGTDMAVQLCLDTAAVVGVSYEAIIAELTDRGFFKH